jgi:hypothetical protein
MKIGLKPSKIAIFVGRPTKLDRQNKIDENKRFFVGCRGVGPRSGVAVGLGAAAGTRGAAAGGAASAGHGAAAWDLSAARLRGREAAGQTWGGERSVRAGLE